MSSVNKVILIGHLGTAPDVRTTSSLIKSAKFSLATNDTWRDKASGETKNKSEWHNIVIYNVKIIEFVERYVKKGDMVYIEGKLTTRTYEKDSIKKYITEVVLGQFQGDLQLLSSKNMSAGVDTNEASIEYYPKYHNTDTAEVAKSLIERQAILHQESDIDDEIPF